MTKRFGRNMLNPLKKGSTLSTRKRVGGTSDASISVVSDNDTVAGQQSVAARTVDSQVTIKVSNKNHKSSHSSSSSNHNTSLSQSTSQQKKESSKPWRSLKRFVGGKKTPTSYSPREVVSNKSSGGGSGGGGSLNRILSVNAAAISHQNASATACPTAASSRHAYELDKAIRGRLDGIDTLSLGPASRPLCLPSDKKKKIITTEMARAGGEKTPHNPKGEDSACLLRNVDPLTVSFTGNSDDGYAPIDSVFDMLWTSEGKDQSELIFEGYVPGGSDRWTVKLEDIHQKGEIHQKEEEIPVSTVVASSSTIATGEITEDGYLNNTILSKPISIDDICGGGGGGGGGEDDVLSHDESTAVSTAVMSDDDGSPNMPIHRIWDQMWGVDSPPPLPSHMQAGGEGGDTDEVLQLAAACSVPIDLDEDTFLIESPTHLRAVHDLTMVPLQGRRFESAMMIFKNLLAGFEGSSLNPKMEHLVGVTYHNIGILYLCLGNFDDALQNFDKAVTARIECLPRNHPDIAVSLARHGTAYFALGSFEQALNSFNMALDIFPNPDATRAKLLNSIGAILAFQGKHTEAMKVFTSALEIQRVWLESPVRRDSLVYDASITLENMGKLYLWAGDYDLSYFVYEEACVLLTTAFRRDHDIVLTCLENMARVLAKRGEYQQALEVLPSIYEAQHHRVGFDNVKCIETLGLLGYMHSKLFEFDDAQSKFEIVSDWQTKNLPTSHPSAQIVTESMKKLRVYLFKDVDPSSAMSC